MSDIKEFKKLVKESGYKISHICREAGVTQQTFTNFVNTGKVNVVTLQSWCDAIGYELVIQKKQ